MDKETLKSLLYKNESVADLAPEIMAEADAFCEGYKKFLDNGKTEREVCTYSENLLKNAGYRPFVPGEKLQAGDKVYWINRKKCVLAATIGKKSLAEGFHLNIAHIDSPRLDLRPMPLYESSDMAFLRTHYYGGIRKYQWPTIPLSLHGVIYRADGSCVEINIGEKDEDPVFCITDLLPHLGAKQSEKKLNEAITGENLNVLIASRPVADKDLEQRVKLNVLQMLHQTYGITEKDFINAEIEVVPAFKARDIGLDRAMIGSYGHDDRVDAYPALMAEIETREPAYTSVCVLTGQGGDRLGRRHRPEQYVYLPLPAAALCRRRVWITSPHSRPPSACPPMSRPPMTPTLPMPLSPATPPMRATVLPCTNTPAPAANLPPTTLRLNWSAI